MFHGNPYIPYANYDPPWGMDDPMPCHASKAYDWSATILANEIEFLQEILAKVTNVQLTHPYDK